MQGPLLCCLMPALVLLKSLNLQCFSIFIHVQFYLTLRIEGNLQPNAWDTGDVRWVNLRPKTFKILYAYICLLRVDLTGNLSLEEGFMQPVLQGIFPPFLRVCRYQRFQSARQPLSSGSPAQHWEILWDFRPEASDFFQSAKDQKSSEVSWATASDVTFCLLILKCLQRLRPLACIAFNYVT